MMLYRWLAGIVILTRSHIHFWLGVLHALSSLLSVSRFAAYTSLVCEVGGVVSTVANKYSTSC